MFKKVFASLQHKEFPMSTLTTTFPPLHVQKVVSAEKNLKIRLSLLGTAMVDALGGPVEFRRRFSFDLVTSMKPNDNFNLGSGVWTDDTSMALCLARSLATFQSPSSSTSTGIHRKGGFDPKDQLDAYLRWFEDGELSAVGRCFDIGNTIKRALSIFERHIQNSGIEKTLAAIEETLNGDECSGNGSLMRVLPVGLAYWKNEQTARGLARKSSVTTHPNDLCQEACEVWTGAIVRILQASTPGLGVQYTKVDLLDYFAKFPYQTKVLRTALTLPDGVEEPPSSVEGKEDFYRKHHPILRLVHSHQEKASTEGDWIQMIPNEKLLPSTGYVVHSLVAALYCFLATKSFEEGAILAINLGSDADTVGAIYGGLAACWYVESEEAKTGDLFWGEASKGWMKALVRRDLVEKVAEELVQVEKTLSKEL